MSQLCAQVLLLLLLLSPPVPIWVQGPDHVLPSVTSLLRYMLHHSISLHLQNIVQIINYQEFLKIWKLLRMLQHSIGLPRIWPHACETSSACRSLFWRLFIEDHPSKRVSPLLCIHSQIDPGALPIWVHTELPHPFKLLHSILHCCLSLPCWWTFHCFQSFILYHKLFCNQHPCAFLCYCFSGIYTKKWKC